MKSVVLGLFCASFLFVAGCVAGTDVGANDGGPIAESPDANGDGSVEESTDALRPRPRLCLSNRQCAANQFCEKQPGRCSALGLCQTRPEICQQIYDPVCGCDGKTYSNDCQADGAGVSVASEGACPGVFCGGIAGFPCPGMGTCADDPSDDCDPDNGGADCGGICECMVNALCVRGFHFDSSPKVCACVPDEPSPCATVLCAPGTVCVAVDGIPRCEPVADPCATVRCKSGTHCVADGGIAACVPDSGSPCGDVTCPVGMECCNASCGWCVRPGMACIQIACN